MFKFGTACCVKCASSSCWKQNYPESDQEADVTISGWAKTAAMLTSHSHLPLLLSRSSLPPPDQFRHTHKYCQDKHLQHMDPSLPKRHVTAAAAQSNWLSLQKHLPLRKWKVIFSMKIYICQNTSVAPHRLNQILSVSAFLFFPLPW